MHERVLAVRLVKLGLEQAKIAQRRLYRGGAKVCTWCTCDGILILAPTGLSKLIAKWEGPVNVKYACLVVVCQAVVRSQRISTEPGVHPKLYRVPDARKNRSDKAQRMTELRTIEASCGDGFSPGDLATERDTRPGWVEVPMNRPGKARYLTDHTPRRWTTQEKELSRRLNNWGLALQDYSFWVKRWPGKEVGKADTPSSVHPVLISCVPTLGLKQGGEVCSMATWFKPGFLGGQWITEGRVLQGTLPKLKIPGNRWSERKFGLRVESRRTSLRPEKGRSCEESETRGLAGSQWGADRWKGRGLNPSEREVGTLQRGVRTWGCVSEHRPATV